MKKLHVLSAVLVMGFLTFGCSQKDDLQVQDDATTLKSASLAGKYIVVLKEDVSISKADLQARKSKVQEKASGLLKKYEVSGEIEEVYETALQGFTVKMAPGQVKKMEMDENVGYIEEDQIIALSPIEMKAKPGGGGGSTAQTIPWGITQVGGVSPYTGNGVVWVIDTGIDFDHPELNVNAGMSKTFVASKSADDDNGHGTHVAGTIAAKNNTIGVVGIAPGATLIAVKVLSRSGSGTTSGVVSGIDYVAANCKIGDVANMSLGGSISTTLDAAVLSASTPHNNINGASQFVKFALAAGNETDNANNHSPARVNGSNIYTVSAMDVNKYFASFSNYGNPPIECCAPGVDIKSTYMGGGYATMSGTSMATPHVAGLLLMGSFDSQGFIHTNGVVDGDKDSKPDPIAHR